MWSVVWPVFWLSSMLAAVIAFVVAATREKSRQKAAALLAMQAQPTADGMELDANGGSLDNLEDFPQESLDFPEEPLKG